MDVLSIVILAVIIVWFALSICYIKKNKGGSCGSCSGDCSQCSKGGYEKKNSKENKK